jgi:hypothetical protein
MKKIYAIVLVGIMACVLFGLSGNAEAKTFKIGLTLAERD